MFVFYRGGRAGDEPSTQLHAPPAGGITATDQAQRQESICPRTFRSLDQYDCNKLCFVMNIVHVLVYY